MSVPVALGIWVGAVFACAGLWCGAMWLEDRRAARRAARRELDRRRVGL